MKDNDRFILDIKRLGINGEGIGFYNRMAIFVPNAIPGEGHDIEITSVKGNMAFGKSLEIKNISKDRKVPECPYYGNCGGCNTMHISYEKMLEEKRNLLIEAINRYTKINPKKFEIFQTVGSPNQFNYRNRSQLQVRKYEDGLHVCMLKENSNITVPINDCLVQKNIINDINEKIIEIMEKMGFDAYNHKNKNGNIRYITIRANKKNEALVCLVCYKKDDNIKNLAIEINKIPEVKGVYESINSNIKENTILGETINHLVGEEYIIEEIGKIKYQIYPNTFFQLNSEQAEELFNRVLKVCKLSRKETVLDAYCGVGAIGLFLAKMSKEVIGIENNKDSIECANKNAQLNKINNASFYHGDASILLPKMLNEGKQFDVIVVDPPRTGLSDKFMKSLLESNVKRIVYVSCNPSTLAKNLEVLSSKYNINSITPLDLFPQTSNVETVVTLSLRD